MIFTISSAVVDFLKQNPDQKFTALEIAKWIFATYPKECRKKQARSKATVTPLDNDLALIRQIAGEIGAHHSLLQRKNPQLKTTEDRPREYYFTSSSESEEVERAEQKQFEATANQDKTFNEQSLYPKLSKFLWSEFNLYSKRIDEKRSKNSHGPKGNKWLYPDVVGMENLSSDWDQEVSGCVALCSDKKTKLWSFEVKVLINRSNLREVFFQTVSNSSWANFGYLVASEMTGSETLKELRILAGLHGLGFILLDVADPSESRIIIPAKERFSIDWNTANRLARENTDFLEYIKLVRQFYQTGDVRAADWKPV